MATSKINIVNLERIRGYNSINFRKGYQMTEIRTPNEIFRHEDSNRNTKNGRTNERNSGSGQS
ncbi:MAG: hypothetical protein OXH57_06390 [Ekhidna sp.]|nr:hypothetical protein [Ekhidna sp.]